MIRYAKADSNEDMKAGAAVYRVVCDECKELIGVTAQLKTSAAGGRCVPCKGFTVGRTVWVRGSMAGVKSIREAVITGSRAYDQCVSIRPVTYKSRGIERWHHHLIHLEKPHE